MTPHKQLIQHDPKNGRFGDCYRTCIASILDLEPAEVPHFYGSPEGGAGDQRDQAISWLGQMGLSIAQLYYDASVEAVLETTKANCIGVPIMMSGQSRLGVNHTVVIMDGEIVCDPSGNGIIGPCDDGHVWIEMISVGANWQAGCRIAWQQMSRAFAVIA